MSDALQKYLAAIRQATKRPGFYAYRGHKKATYKLRSSATRRLTEQYREEVLRRPDFRRIYVNYHQERLLEPARERQADPNTPESDLQVLAKLQHLGAATGLLDFSWSPLVALWMACQDSNHDGCVFVVNTSVTSDVTRVPYDARQQDVKALFTRSDNEPPLSYWEPHASGEAQSRILMQRSVFIIGRPSIPEEFASSARSVAVRKNDKTTLLDDLRILDITESSLFRDIPGLAQAECVKTPIHTWQNAQHSLLQGNRFHQERKFGHAIEAYTDCINREPGICEPYFLRGNSHAALGSHKQAIADYSNGIQRKDRPYLDSESTAANIDKRLLSRIYFNCGNSRAALRKHAVAIDDYNRALEVDRDGDIGQFSGVYFNRGNSFVIVREFARATKDYDSAIGLGLLHAHFNRANALVMQGRFTEAESAYLAVHSKVHDSNKVENNLANLRRILTILGGQEADVTPDELAKGVPIQRITLQVPSGKKPDWGGVIFAGNVGNTGNFGGETLSGGEGAAGSIGFAVVLQ